MRPLVFLLLFANLTLFGYIRLDQMATGEGIRLSQQVEPDKIKLLTPQQVAALGPTKVGELNDVCLQWGPFSESERVRALAALEPLQLGRLVSQKKAEINATHWVYIPPLPNRPAAEAQANALRALGVRDFNIIETGPQRLAISLGAFRAAETANTRLAALQRQGLDTARVGSLEQTVAQTLLVIRDPPHAGAARLKELQAQFAGSELRTSNCEKTG